MVTGHGHFSHCMHLLLVVDVLSLEEDSQWSELEGAFAATSPQFVSYLFNRPIDALCSSSR